MTLFASRGNYTRVQGAKHWKKNCKLNLYFKFQLVSNYGAIF